MASSTLTSLLASAAIDDHEEILKASNSALKQSSGDVEALRTKIIALLRLDRYEDALQTIGNGETEFQQKCYFEKAYALYKLGKLEDARKTAGDIADHRGAKHVEAQSLYRLERFGDASSLYQSLSGNGPEAKEEANDLRINSGAIEAQLGWQQTDHSDPRKPTREELDAFETSFNAACRSIASGEFAQAEVLLKRAKDLCNALDELSESQKAEELAPIEVQQVFVLHNLGKHEAAEQLASNISIDKIPDASTKNIAQNNILAASRNANPYLSQKLLQGSKALLKAEKVFHYQTAAMQESNLALDLMINKPAVVLRRTGEQLAHSRPSTSAHINKLSVLNAAAQAQSELGKMGLKRILPLLEKRSLDIALVITVIHLYLLTDNKGSAVTVMQSLLKRLEASNAATDQDVRFAPGLVAAAVSLYGHDGRKSQVKSELAKAARYWRYQSRPPRQLLQASGRSLLESGDQGAQRDAQEIFDMLYEQDPKEKGNIAGFVAAHSHDPSICVGQAEKLTPIHRLTAGIDVTALEAAGVPPDPGSNTLHASQKRALDDMPQTAKKRLRKSRLPKAYDPSKTPDPERWLPLKDRSTYRPKKGKKGKQKTAALTQGGISEKEGEKQDHTSSAGVTQAPGGPIKNSSRSSKKKKGKK